MQNKAFEYAFGILGARGFADQEDAHSKWNCFKKAVTRSNLSMALLRLTLICILNSINSFLCFFLVCGFHVMAVTRKNCCF